MYFIRNRNVLGCNFIRNRNVFFKKCITVANKKMNFMKMQVRVKCRLGVYLFPISVKKFNFITTHLYMAMTHKF